MKRQEFDALVNFLNTAKGNKPNSKTVEQAFVEVHEAPRNSLSKRVLKVSAEFYDWEHKKLDRLTQVVGYHCDQYGLTDDHYRAAMLVLQEGKSRCYAAKQCGFNSAIVCSLVKRIERKLELYDKWLESR